MHSSERAPVGTRRYETPGAVAIVKGDPPEVLLAENASVMSRLIALRIVAASDPALFSRDDLRRVRAALLEERWTDAVMVWMETTGTFIDVYEQYVRVWSENELDAEGTSMEIRMARIFADR
jgi:hypothetical protein